MSLLAKSRKVLVDILRYNLKTAEKRQNELMVRKNWIFVGKWDR